MPDAMAMTMVAIIIHPLESFLLLICLYILIYEPFLPIQTTILFTTGRKKNTLLKSSLSVLHTMKQLVCCHHQ